MEQHIILIIKDLQPQIHYLALFIRLLTWREKKSHTILLICSCILVQQFYKPFFILLLPLVCYCAPLKYSKKNTLIEDLTDIRNSLQFISNIKSCISSSHTHYSNYLFIGTYTVWIILSRHFNVWWSSMMLVLFVHSPWYPFIHHACISPFMSTTAPTPTNSDNDRVYCFEVYHHQRWWFPAGWSNLLLPQDPSVWSDTHLEPTPSIYNFSLPPATDQQKRVSWTWLDPEWNIVRDETTDSEGWQYGNWQWKNWEAQSGRLGICTRRQKWYRYAQRHVEDVAIDEHEQESSISECDTCVVSDSNSIDTKQQMYSPIVSFDNKGEKMLRRRSSNKTISIELNTYSVDTCTPKRLKRFSI